MRNNHEAIELLRQLHIEEVRIEAGILVVITRAMWRDRHALISEVVSLMPEELKQGVAMETIAITIDNWGRAIMSKGKRREAIPYFEKASELAPKAAVPCFDLGRCYYALGDYDLAVTWLTRAIELEPENLNWFAQRALV